VSTAGGWQQPPDTQLEIQRDPVPPESSMPGTTRLFVRVTLTPEADPVAALDDRASAWTDPAVRLMLAPDPGAGFTSPHYALLSRLRVSAVSVAMVVVPPQEDRPSLPVRVWNDNGPVDVSAPFLPFGPTPAVGARLRLGSAEFFSKKITTLQLVLTWQGIPPGLATTYYAGYRSTADSGVRSFATEITFVRRGSWTPSSQTYSPFGEPRKGADVVSVPLSEPGPAARSGVPAGGAASQLLAGDPHGWPAVAEMTLTGADFGHTAYPAALTRKSVQFAAALSAGGVSGDPDALAAAYTVNPPWTPTLQSFKVGYRAEDSIDLGTAPVAAGPAGEDALPGQVRFWHVHPFGRSHETATDQSPPLLPTYQNAGELYLGLTDVPATASVAILFQVAEGSAEPDLAAPVLLWSYLDGESWQPFPAGAVLSDTTNNFLNSGIVELALPVAAPSMLLPPGRYWIRAAVQDNAPAVADMIGIRAQAVAATYVDPDPADPTSTHADQPLPVGSVSELNPAVPGIRSVEQPYSSAGGRGPEDGDRFARRVRERLRHRGRAVSGWDYERLVLQQFPDVSRAKCLPADGSTPGLVELVVLPDMRNRIPFNPFEPKVPANRLAAIDRYLTGRIPGTARLRVRNASFLSIRVRVNVRFRTGRDVGYYRQQLSTDLDRFLSPWAFDHAAEVVIGGEIWVGSIVAFVDDREYVDHVDGIELLARDERSLVWLPLRTVVSTSAPDTVLVSAANHEIVVLADEQDTGERWTGIGYMIIGLDFAVA
jgi:hypothetical protein